MAVLAALGLLIIRLVVGLTFAAHGTQKLFGWFGGHGLEGTGGFFDSVGIKPGKTMALMAGISEVLGGLLFAAGLLTPFAALVIICTMIVAILKVHGPNGYWVTQNGAEYNVMLIVVTLGVALIGAGTFSLDALLF
ncbi:DoxX family protein [Bacillus sp. KH172YL63]|uniref:DoxX family protein n=1 Tax=Bacillus sp. KH172YL63 TaxID=2709784 RepID=UPI0013E445B4|nr:DoxX family protein [Bacillus sp. KH172YL63]BCB02836.1 oxidoreductase [Bacillus sp. KH172YL63]